MHGDPLPLPMTPQPLGIFFYVCVCVCCITQNSLPPPIHPLPPRPHLHLPPPLLFIYWMDLVLEDRELRPFRRHCTLHYHLIWIGSNNNKKVTKYFNERELLECLLGAESRRERQEKSPSDGVGNPAPFNPRAPPRFAYTTASARRSNALVSALTFQPHVTQHRLYRGLTSCGPSVRVCLSVCRRVGGTGVTSRLPPVISYQREPYCLFITAIWTLNAAFIAVARRLPTPTSLIFSCWMKGLPVTWSPTWAAEQVNLKLL